MAKLSILKSSHWRKLLILPPILVGAALLAFMVRGRSGPEQVEIAEEVRTLRVIQVPMVDVVPRVVGYGTAQPADVWTAVAEVRGRVVEVHPELKAGAIIRQGDVILRIDPQEYEFQIAQLEAEIAQVRSQQAELKAEEANLRASIKIEKASLELAERDLERLESLSQTASVSESEVDEQRRAVLTQRQSVQSLQNSLRDLPARQEALTATLAARQASLERARLDLDRTVIKTPLDCRLRELAIEQGQVLVAGQVLFEAYGLDVMEVEAQLPIDQARNLMPKTGQTYSASLISSLEAMSIMRKIFDVSAIVRMRTGDFVVEWPGRFDRVREQLDTSTRTVQIVIAVDKPFDNVIPGTRPPLAPGMFCEVELRGKPQPDRIAIPRSAIRGDHVYVVNAENRLERRTIQIAFSQGGVACLESGLASGDKLVVSDPTPAIEGMLVDPVLDEQIAQATIADATAQARLEQEETEGTER